MTTTMPNLEKIFPADRYDCIPKVAVFKTHQRHKGGRLVTVGKKELEKIAKNHNGQFVKLLRASPFSKGHTLDEGPDGADVPEENQPDVVGYGVKFFVDKLASEPDEDYLFCDLYLMKEHKGILETYPAISPEYYPSLDQLYPISFLKSSAPELSLPPVLHRYEMEVDEDEPYRLTMDNPLSYANPKEKVTMDKSTEKECYEKDDDKKAMEKAEEKETKGAKGDSKAIADLQDQMEEIMQVLPALKELVEMLSQAGEEEPEDEEGDESDLLEPHKDEEKDEEVANDNKSPVKFGSSAATATNVSVPSNNKEEYKVTNDELVRYKAEVESEMQNLRVKAAEALKLAEDLNKKNRRAEAEKLVYKLENDFNIVFTSEAVKEEETVTLTELDPESANVYFERAKVRYQKKTPNSEKVKEVIKYSTENPDDIKSLPPEDSKKLADKIVASGMNMTQYLDSLRNRKV